MIPRLILVRNTFPGKHSCDRTQISTPEKMLSLSQVTVRNQIFFKGLIYLFIYLFWHQQDLNHWERMWALKLYNCELCGSDFVSCTALRYHFQQKHLGKVHCEKCGQEVPGDKLQDHSKVPGCTWGRVACRQRAQISVDVVILESTGSKSLGEDVGS